MWFSNTSPMWQTKRMYFCKTISFSNSDLHKSKEIVYIRDMVYLPNLIKIRTHLYQQL